MAALPVPTSPFDPVDPQWQNYFQSLATAANVTIPPINARYLLATSNAELTNDVNLGALASGVLVLSVGGGIATPLTLAQLTVVRGGTGADLSATGGAGHVVRQSAVGGAFTVSPLAAAELADVAPGTYTPTLTAVTNVAASTAHSCQYLRVGPTVTVSGLVEVDPTGAGSVELGISLPVASNFTAAEQCAGVAASPAVAGLSAAILADATTDRASLQWVAVDTANRTFAFTFMYRVL